MFAPNPPNIYIYIYIHTHTDIYIDHRWAETSGNHPLTAALLLKALLLEALKKGTSFRICGWNFPCFVEFLGRIPNASISGL